MNKIDNLKYAIFSEWSCDPPAGSVNIYYDVCGTTYDKFMEVVEITYENMRALVGYAGEDCDDEENEELYDDNEGEEYEPDDDAHELYNIYKSIEPTKESIGSYSFDSGGCGCGCDFIAEGKEIAQQAADFYDYYLAEYYADDEERTRKNEKIVKKAVDNPENYNAVMKLIDLINDGICNLDTY